MTVLEEKIKQNREHYDAHEPADGHLDRFSSLLDKEFHADKISKSGRLTMIKYAAGILLLGAIAAILMIQFIGNSSELQANAMDDELLVVMDHYDRLADQKLGEISDCIESDQEAIKVNEMARAQIEKLDQDAGALKEELNSDASNKRVYDALVNNYRTRIRILDNIISRICEL
ncbi:MAG: hypothetical protein ABFS05_12165 [Bacteroidota bacterium]